MNKPTVDEMVEAVQQHAHANYDTGGWDYLVEAVDREEIVEEVQDCTSIAEAIAKVGEWMAILEDRCKDIQAEVF